MAVVASLEVMGWEMRIYAAIAIIIVIVASNFRDLPSVPLLEVTQASWVP